MELFLEFVFTVSLSLVLSFILSKLLSLSSAIDQHLEALSRSCMEATTKSEKHVFECEKGIGFVSEVVEESLNGSYGSTKVANQETVEETSCGDEENFVNETTEIEPAKEVEEEEEIEVLECEKENGEDQLQGVLTDDDDDWEGIERSALEKDCAAALCRSNADDQTLKLGNDVKMQLYGLHKIATQGPCHDPQPMALKLSARAKWNAWKRLGNMSPEAAMEQYISLVSRSIPNEWMQDDDICVASWKLPLDVKTMPADQAIAVDYWTFNDLKAQI